MKIRLLLVFCAAFPAWTGTAWGEPKTSVDVEIEPRATGRPHVCVQYYPRDAVRAEIQGTTALAFTIGADGHVGGIQVLQSSGSEELDDVAVFCAGHWTYSPAMRDGAPVSTPWIATVTFGLSPSYEGQATFAVPRRISDSAACAIYFPRDIEVKDVAGDTFLHFMVGTDGSVSDIEVVQSSGKAEVDAAGVLCASHWRFAPAVRNGEPFATHWAGGIDWQSAVASADSRSNPDN